MGQSSAVSAHAHGPTPHRKIVRRRHVEFENFSELISIDGNTTKVPIKYSTGYYTRMRGLRRLPRGEGPLWSDPDQRAHLLQKLRQKLQKLREARERDRDHYDRKMSALWKHAQEARPELYRHILLEAMSSSPGEFVVNPPEEWSDAFTNEAIQAAKENFHCVYHTGGRMHSVEDAGGVPASVQPTFVPGIGTGGGPIRNSSRTTPSRLTLGSPSRAEQPGTASVTDENEAESTGGAADSPRAPLAAAQARTDRFIFDTGASKHSPQHKKFQ